MYKLRFHYIQINEYSSSFPITKEEKMCTCDFREEGQKKKKTHQKTIQTIAVVGLSKRKLR